VGCGRTPDPEAAVPGQHQCLASVQAEENHDTRDGVGVGLGNPCAATDQHPQQEEVDPRSYTWEKY